jgi:hypothetical protein
MVSAKTTRPKNLAWRPTLAAANRLNFIMKKRDHRLSCAIFIFGFKYAAPHGSLVGPQILGMGLIWVTVTAGFV